MSKVTLDITAFKALASDTRLDILKTLDGKNMNLKEICNATKLNKATLHEHLSKLTEAGLIKRIEREGHKWVYYKLSWKGSSLLHPENTKIVILFSLTIISLFFGFIGLINYFNLIFSSMKNVNIPFKSMSPQVEDALKEVGVDTLVMGQDHIFLYINIIFLLLFSILLFVSIIKYKNNKTPKL